MTVNFQEKSCQKLVKDKEFGIYDAEDKTPAKIIEHNSDLCNARVTNKREVDILFTAIDNCIIIIRPNGEMDNRCDAMLCYESNAEQRQYFSSKYKMRIQFDAEINIE